MKVMEIDANTHHQHVVKIKLRDTKWMETREKVSFEPRELELTWERKNKHPIALTRVIVSGAPYGKSTKLTRSIGLKYAAAMEGDDPSVWATEHTWRDRFAKAPEWVRWMISENWPTDF